jgi:hypothetical protein
MGAANRMVATSIKKNFFMCVHCPLLCVLRSQPSWSLLAGWLAGWPAFLPSSLRGSLAWLLSMMPGSTRPVWYSVYRNSHERKAGRQPGDLTRVVQVTATVVAKFFSVRFVVLFPLPKLQGASVRNEKKLTLTVRFLF